MEPKLFVATKAFILNEGKVLILRESKQYEDGANASRYDLPGGRLTPGEYFSDALKREVLEETGMVIEVGGPVAVAEWRPVVRGEQWQIVGICFKCVSSSKEVTLSKDHDGYEWIDPKEYASYGIIENLKPVFEEYLK